MIKNFKNILFIDIETASGVNSFTTLTVNMQKLWLRKARSLMNPLQKPLEDLYFERAALFPEFGRIISIGMGFLFYNKNKELSLKVKTISNKNEKDLLLEFNHFIESTYPSKELSLVAHNGKEFDFPYLCKRMLVHQLVIPKALQLQGKKPWEVVHQDTIEWWRFGDKKGYVSLELLAEIMGIDNVKTDLSGDKVNYTFYIEKDLEKIKKYCAEDVITLAQLFLRFNFIDYIQEKNIQRITDN
ncbi:MAG: hypothetical protein RIR51_743 [Bacteroidota bacterium]